jgi:hypothetical protein
MDPDRLAAFVDGELSPEDAASVVLHLADCPQDRAHVDALMETGALLAAAYAEPLHQAVPERLRAAIFPTSARTAPARAARRRGGAPTRRQTGRIGWGITGVAASALLVIGLVQRDGPAREIVAGPITAGSALHAALERMPSGPAPEGLTLIGTFHDAAGRPCREFEAFAAPTGVVTRGIACRETGGGWTTIAAFSEAEPAGPGPTQAFIPAGGADGGDLDAVLDRIGAGMTLTPAEEAALLDAGWTD